MTLTGTGTGTMDYTIRFFDGADTLLDERSFSQVPVTEDTIITTDTDSADATVLSVDRDGDGVEDFTWTAEANELVTTADSAPGERGDTEPAAPAPEGSMSNFTLSGEYKGYSDVDESKWYGVQKEGVIRDVTLLGIMQGGGDGSFKPDSEISLAEVIKMAAVARNTYNGGSYDFGTVSGANWYVEYTHYAIENGIITAGDFDMDYTRKATRAEMAYIFAKALPVAEFPSISRLTPPDVSPGDAYANEIFTLYAAGVLRGSDSTGLFSGSAHISRAEAAAIIARVALPDNRA